MTDVALSTVENVRALLSASAEPMSRNGLLALLARSGHSTTRRRLNRALAFFFELGLAVESPRGILWVQSGEDEVSIRYLAHLISGPYEENGCGPPAECVEELRAEVEAIRATPRGLKPRKAEATAADLRQSDA